MKAEEGLEALFFQPFCLQAAPALKRCPKGIAFAIIKVSDSKKYHKNLLVCFT